MSMGIDERKMIRKIVVHGKFSLSTCLSFSLSDRDVKVLFVAVMIFLEDIKVVRKSMGLCIKLE